MRESNTLYSSQPPAAQKNAPLQGALSDAVGINDGLSSLVSRLASLRSRLLGPFAEEACPSTPSSGSEAHLGTLHREHTGAQRNLKDAHDHITALEEAIG